jgi:pimeloyl-ACP methyl ester carboxylesterase
MKYVRLFFRFILNAYVAAFAFFNFSSFCAAIADEPLSKYVRQSSGASTVIVFVHGFMGDGVSTWTSDETGAYWPAMLTHDPTFDGVDIFVYSYDTGFNSPLAIDELAENMRLVLVANGVSNYNKIVFLSHSMGGLVTRAYLLKDRHVAAHTLFAYFFSTPTTGSQIASILHLLVGTSQVNELKTMTDEAYLAGQLRDWLAAGFKFPSYCAYEKKVTNGTALVVNMGSAVSLCTRAVDPIDTDHIGIVKPASQNSVSYMAFKAAYLESTTPVPQPMPPSSENSSSPAIIYNGPGATMEGVRADCNSMKDTGSVVKNAGSIKNSEFNGNVIGGTGAPSPECSTKSRPPH